MSMVEGQLKNVNEIKRQYSSKELDKRVREQAEFLIRGYQLTIDNNFNKRGVYNV